MQIVSERVSMLNPAKDDEWYDPAKVKEFLGVAPAQVADLFALKGDAIDNIPGAPGIGDKGARDLIERFGSVEAAIERAAEVERKMYRESLQNNVERILMSKRLATIDTAVPIEFELESVRARDADPHALKQVYKDLEFHSLLKELGPSEDTRTRDYQALESGAALAEWLRTVPRGCAGGGGHRGIPAGRVGSRHHPQRHRRRVAIRRGTLRAARASRKHRRGNALARGCRAPQDRVRREIRATGAR